MGKDTEIRRLWRRHIGVAPRRLTCDVESYIVGKYPDMDTEERSGLISRLNRHYNSVIRSNFGRPSRLPPACPPQPKVKHAEHIIVIRCGKDEHAEMLEKLGKCQGIPRFFRVAREVMRGTFYLQEDIPDDAKRYNIRLTAPSEEVWEAVHEKMPRNTRANYHLLTAALDAPEEGLPTDRADPELQEAIERATPVHSDDDPREWRAWSVLATNEQWKLILDLMPASGEDRTDWLLSLPESRVCDKRFPPTTARSRTLRILATDEEYVAVKKLYDTNPYGRTIALIDDLRAKGKEE